MGFYPQAPDHPVFWRELPPDDRWPELLRYFGAELEDGRHEGDELRIEVPLRSVHPPGRPTHVALRLADWVRGVRSLPIVNNVGALWAHMKVTGFAVPEPPRAADVERILATPQ